MKTGKQNKVHCTNFLNPQKLFAAALPSQGLIQLVF